MRIFRSTDEIEEAERMAMEKGRLSLTRHFTNSATGQLFHVVFERDFVNEPFAYILTFYL